MKRKLLCIVFALILIMSFNVKSFADFGDFAGDNDYGYDYDDNDYDYDYDDDDDYYYHSYDDDDDDKSYSVHYYYTYTEAPDGSYAGYTKSYNSDYKEIAVGSLLSATDTEKSDSGSDAVLGFIVVCIIAIIIFAAKRKNNSGTNKNLRSRPVAPGAVPTDVSNYTPMSKYTEAEHDHQHRRQPFRFLRSGRASSSERATDCGDGPPEHKFALYIAKFEIFA